MWARSLFLSLLKIISIAPGETVAMSFVKKMSDIQYYVVDSKDSVKIKTTWY